MSFRTGRQMKDGNMTGYKQDKFRNSDFEYDEDTGTNQMRGVSRATPNTLGTGRFNENRGRRGDEDWNRPREDNPYENGKLYNWNHRQGWDQYYDQSFDRVNRNRGGSLVGPDHQGQHRGRGPKGYSRPDNRVYEDVCETLALSPDVDASDIEVTVKEGCVYLNGFVDGREMKRMAELEIENISGVIDVQNLLSIRRNSDKSGDSGRTPEARLS